MLKSYANDNNFRDLLNISKYLKLRNAALKSNSYWGPTYPRESGLRYKVLNIRVRVKTKVFPSPRLCQLPPRSPPAPAWNSHAWLWQHPYSAILAQTSWFCQQPVPAGHLVFQRSVCVNSNYFAKYQVYPGNFNQSIVALTRDFLSSRVLQWVVQLPHQTLKCFPKWSTFNSVVRHVHVLNTSSTIISTGEDLLHTAISFLKS